MLELLSIALFAAPAIIYAAASYRRADAEVIRARRIDPKHPDFHPPQGR